MKSGHSAALKPAKRGLSSKGNKCSDTGIGDTSGLPTNETPPMLLLNAASSTSVCYETSTKPVIKSVCGQHSSCRRQYRLRKRENAPPKRGGSTRTKGGIIVWKKGSRTANDACPMYTLDRVQDMRSWPAKNMHIASPTSASRTLIPFGGVSLAVA